MKQPNARRSLENYRGLAHKYDASCKRLMSVREDAVAFLGLRDGDVVVDVSAGTGLSFPLVMERIGPTGHLIAIELSPDMMALARQRVDAGGWRNVTLIESAVETAGIPLAFDAALFHFTHDVLQSPAALARVFAHAKPGARVAVAGAKFVSWSFAPLNIWIMIRTRRYLTTYAGLRQPWCYLTRYVPDLRIRNRLLGTGYLAHGRFDPHAMRAKSEPKSRALFRVERN